MARAILLLVLFTTAAVAAPKHKGWPATGRCLPQQYRKGPCVTVTPVDAAALQSAVLRYLDARKLRDRPDWRPARGLIAKPITESSIGTFVVETYDFVGHTGDVLRLSAVTDSDSDVERGFRVTLGRTQAGGWKVLYFEAYHDHLPQPN